MGLWYIRAMLARLLRPVAQCGAPLAVLVATCGMLPASAPTVAAALPATAASGRMSERVSLRLVRKSGFDYVHSGTATGSVPGTVRSSMRLDSLSLQGTATVRNRRGTLKMRIDGRARSVTTRAKFDGRVRVTGGTGAYRGATGGGRFTGVVDRKTWSATIEATGSLRY